MHVRSTSVTAAVFAILAPTWTGSTEITRGGDGPLETPFQEAPQEDLLSLATGVTVVSVDGDGAAANASRALRAIDGAPEQIGFTRDGAPPVIYVFEMPGPTTFDRFSVPDVRDTPGNTTFFGAIRIEGSNESPSSGFTVLAEAEFEELESGVSADFVPSSTEPFRWIRLTLSGALYLDPAHPPGRTAVRFSELVGTGTREEVPLSEGFDGIWTLGFWDAARVRGPLLELVQKGATVEGCLDDVTLSGTVTGSVARLNGVDSRGRPSVYLLIATADGELRGLESTNGGVFRARVGEAAAPDASTPCSGHEPELLACGSIAYVNFDLDSAAIRSDSDAVIADLFAGLSAIDGDVTIEGHTSTEGTDEYNLDLSERRAKAVVDRLVAMGIPAGRISAVGKGEAEPLVRESDEVTRALNRRVEIGCEG